MGGLVPGPIWTTDYLVLTAPLGVALLWGHGRAGRAVSLGLAILSVIAVVVGAVRAVWLAEAVIVVVFGLRWVRGRPRSARQTTLVAGTIAVALVAGAVVVAPRLAGLLRSIDEGRVSAIQAAASIFASSPLVGAGPGTYGSLRMGEPADSLSQLTLPDAHNLVAQVSAELGLVGLAALALGTVIVLWKWARPARRLDPLALAGVAALAGAIAHRMVDMVFLIPGLAVMGLVAAAFVAGPARPLTNRGRTAVRTVAVLALGVAIVTTPALVSRLAADSNLVAAVVVDSQGDATSAADAASRSLADAPDLVPAYVARSLAEAETGDLPAAVDDARAAYEREPSTPSRLLLARVLELDQQEDAALALYQEIIVTRPADPAALLNAAVSLGGAGDQQATRLAVRLLLAADPRIARVVDQLPAALRAAAREEAQKLADDRAAQGDFLTAIELYYWLGVPLAEGPIGNSESGDLPAQWSLVQSALDGGDTSWDALVRAATQQPAQLGKAAWWVASETCRPLERDRWARIGEIQSGGNRLSLAIQAGQVPGVTSDMQPSRYPQWISGSSQSPQSVPTGDLGGCVRTGIVRGDPRRRPTVISIDLRPGCGL